MIRRHPNQLRIPHGMIRQGHLGATGPLDDMEVGNDVSFLVPDKSRATALGNLGNIETEEVPLPCQSSDVDHGRRGLPKQRDSRTFLGVQRTARGDGAWGSIGIA